MQFDVVAEVDWRKTSFHERVHQGKDDLIFSYHMRRLHSLLAELLVGSNSLVAAGWLKRVGPAGNCFCRDDLMGQLCPVHSVTTGRYPPPELQRLLCGTELEGANECSVPSADGG